MQASPKETDPMLCDCVTSVSCVVLEHMQADCMAVLKAWVFLTL